jgi:hypothetical protein
MWRCVGLFKADVSEEIVSIFRAERIRDLEMSAVTSRQKHSEKKHELYEKGDQVCEIHERLVEEGVAASVVPGSRILFTLTMEATRSTATSPHPCKRSSSWQGLSFTGFYFLRVTSRRCE